MANDTNSVVLVGRLGRDAELKYVGETALVQFSIAVNTSRKNNSTGKYEDEANWIDVKVWGRGAEAVHKYLEKGKQVCVSGSLRQERWETDGQQRSKIVVNAQSVQLLGGKREDNQGSSGNVQNNTGYGSNYSSQGDAYEDDDLDVPF